MVAPFAAIEARIAATVMAHLANAVADFGAGLMVDGVFHAAGAEVFGLISGEQPRFESTEISLAAVLIGDSVTINAVNYVVVEIKPDGRGMVKLTLETA